MIQYVPTIVIAALILGFIIYRQMRTAPVRPRQLVVFPVVLALLGLSNVNEHPPASEAAIIALVASGVTAIVFGVGRGYTVRIWRANGKLLRKGVAATIVLWIVAIVLRILIGIQAQRAGVAASVSTGEAPLFVAFTLAAQNVVLWLRAQSEHLPG